MAIQLRKILKSWFEVGDTPTETQFADLIDSFFHKKEDSFPEATQTTAGLMSAKDKIKLDELNDTVAEIPTVSEKNDGLMTADMVQAWNKFGPILQFEYDAGDQSYVLTLPTLSTPPQKNFTIPLACSESSGLLSIDNYKKIEQIPEDGLGNMYEITADAGDGAVYVSVPTLNKESPIKNLKIPPVSASLPGVMTPAMFGQIGNAFRDRWITHGGAIDSSERIARYLINGLSLSYGEALTVDEESFGGIFTGSYARIMGKARTFYAIRPHAQSPYSNYAFLGCRNLEVVAVDEGGDPLVVTGTTFAECQSLRRIQGPISLSASVCFADCGMLEEIDPVNGVTRDLDFTSNPNLSADCYRRMLNNTSGSARYTIKVTSEVWQRIKNGSDESWYSLWSLAMAKNISFLM